MRKMVYLLISFIVLLTSCSKQEDICGIILGGYTEWNDYYYRYDYFFRLDVDNRAQVDELTFNSFSVGDYICLDY